MQFRDNLMAFANRDVNRASLADIMYGGRKPSIWIPGVVLFAALCLVAIVLLISVLISGAVRYQENIFLTYALLGGLILIPALRLTFFAALPQVYVTSAGLGDAWGAVIRTLDALVPTVFLLFVVLFVYNWIDAVLSDVTNLGSVGTKRLKAGFALGGLGLVLIGLVFSIGAAIQIASGKAAAGGLTYNNSSKLVAGNWVLQPTFLFLCGLLSMILVLYSTYALHILRNREGQDVPLLRRSAVFQIVLYAIMALSFFVEAGIVMYILIADRFVSSWLQYGVAVMLCESMVLCVVLVIQFFSLKVKTHLARKFPKIENEKPNRSNRIRGAEELLLGRNGNTTNYDQPMEETTNPDY